MSKLTNILNEAILHGPTTFESLDHNMLCNLLRCNALIEEDCTSSIIIYEPYKSKPVKQSLPPFLEDRMSICDTWFSRTKKTSYASFCLNFEEGCNSEEYVHHFPPSPDELEKLAAIAIEHCKKRLPKHRVYAVVAHIGQIICLKDDIIKIGPPHIHIIMEAHHK